MASVSRWDGRPRALNVPKIIGTTYISHTQTYPVVYCLNNELLDARRVPVNNRNIATTLLALNPKYVFAYNS